MQSSTQLQSPPSPSPQPYEAHSTSTTSAASAMPAQLPDVINDEVGDDGGHEQAITPFPQSVNMSSPPQTRTVFVHNSSDVAGAIERAAASARQHRGRHDCNSSANEGATVQEAPTPDCSEEMDVADDPNAAAENQSSTEASNVP